MHSAAAGSVHRGWQVHTVKTRGDRPPPLFFGDGDTGADFLAGLLVTAISAGTEFLLRCGCIFLSSSAALPGRGKHTLSRPSLGTISLKDFLDSFNFFLEEKGVDGLSLLVSPTIPITAGPRSAGMSCLW